MKKFLARHAGRIVSVLSGFDRLRFRGTFRQLAHVSGMQSILSYLGVLLKDFGNFSEQATARFREGVEGVAQHADRPVIYLPSPQTNKEELIQKILREKGTGRDGVIAVFSSVEVCQSYEIRRNRQQRTIELQPARRKCLHYYVYRLDSMFGLVHVRMQSWFSVQRACGDQRSRNGWRDRWTRQALPTCEPTIAFPGLRISPEPRKWLTDN